MDHTLPHSLDSDSPPPFPTHPHLNSSSSTLNPNAPPFFPLEISDYLTLHVPHTPFQLNPSHTYPPSCTLPKYSDTIACTNHSHPYGHPQPTLSGMGNDASDGGATYTTSFAVSLIGLTLSCTTSLSFHKKGLCPAIKLGHICTRKHGLWKRSAPLSNFQLLDKGGTYVLNGNSTQQAG